MPNNLYGPDENFDLETSHVLPAMIRTFHEARLRGDAVGAYRLYVKSLREGRP